LEELADENGMLIAVKVCMQCLIEGLP
jgi:hypothetical protein